MKIKTWIKYMESYLPTPRSRKLRYQEQEEYIDIELIELNIKDVELALQVEDKNYYLHNGNLYTKATHRDISAFENIKNPLENLKYCNENCSSYFGFNDDDTREKMIEKAEHRIQQYILLDGELYKQEAEPVYAIYCFGCGNNHAGIGTSLSITEHPVGNINCGIYFNAFEREKGIKEAIKIANERGDTDSIPYILNAPKIKVLIPSVIKAKTNTNN